MSATDRAAGIFAALSLLLECRLVRARRNAPLLPDASLIGKLIDLNARRFSFFVHVEHLTAVQIDDLVRAVPNVHNMPLLRWTRNAGILIDKGAVAGRTPATSSAKPLDTFTNETILSPGFVRVQL